VPWPAEAAPCCCSGCSGSIADGQPVYLEEQYVVCLVRGDDALVYADLVILGPASSLSLAPPRPELAGTAVGVVGLLPLADERIAYVLALRLIGFVAILVGVLLEDRELLDHRPGKVRMMPVSQVRWRLDAVAAPRSQREAGYRR